MGDAVLQRVSREAATELRSGDTIGRFGGEEFVVLLPNTAVDEAQVVLTRLQRALRRASAGGRSGRA